MKILITSTSFQDTPGKHHALLATKKIRTDYLRGPLKERELLSIEWNYDGIIMGDDEYTKPVLESAKAGGLKVLSKYGVGLDKVDLEAAKTLGIIVKNCPGLNHSTVAEHVFGLLLSYYKNIFSLNQSIKAGNWERQTGRELAEKNLAIIGLGKVGKEVAKIAKCFGMKIYAYDKYFDQNFATINHINEIKNLNVDLMNMDIITLHCNLDAESKGIISQEILKENTKNDVVIVNTARAHLVDREALSLALKDKYIGAYLSDVWYDEPMSKNEPLIKYENLILTPHVASRTFENVEKQGTQAIINLCEILGV